MVYLSMCDTPVGYTTCANDPLRLPSWHGLKTPGRYGDGGGGGLGLDLRVHMMKSERVSKSWGQRIRVGGKPTNLGLGSYPVVTLGEAREKALENRRSAYRGKTRETRGFPPSRRPSRR